MQARGGFGEFRSRLFCVRAAGVSPACPGYRLEFVGYELAEAWRRANSEKFWCRCSVRFSTAWRSAWRVNWKCSSRWVAHGGLVEYPMDGESATTALRRREHFITQAVTVSGADVAKCSRAAADAQSTNASVKTGTTTSVEVAGGAGNRSGISASSAVHDIAGRHLDCALAQVEPELYRRRHPAVGCWSEGSLI